jgi:protein CpxP
LHAGSASDRYFDKSLKENAMKSVKTSFTQRALMVGLIAGSGILAASAYAVPERGPAGKPGCESRQGQKDHDKWAERRAERMTELKEKLKLVPEQESAWNTFTRASQPGMRHMGADRKAMRGEFATLNTPQRLDRMQAMSEVRRARMVERAEATKAFYAQLTPEQQSVFDAEAMPMGHRAHHRHHRHQS